MRHAHRTRSFAPRRVHAVGSYGFGNFGDELFVDTVRRRMGLLWPEASVRTFTPSVPSTIYASSSPAGKLTRLGAAAIGLAWADTIAICGGSVLQDVGGVARLRQRALGRRRVEALGVSIGPFPSDAAAQRVEAFLDHVDRLVVRDPASVERLAGLRHHSEPVIGGDLVALNDMIEPTTREENLVTICPSAAAGNDVAVLIHQIADAVAAASTPVPPQIVLLALSTHRNSDDEALCAQVATGLEERGVTVDQQSFGQLGLAPTCRLLARSTMVWSQRLHGAVVAYLAEVPFLLVGHHAKCVDFGNDIGARNRIIGPREPWAPTVSTLTADSDAPLLCPRDYRARARTAYSVTR